MSLYQDYDGLEHTPSGTTLETTLHGKLTGFISITEPQAKVTYPEVKVGGSAYAVAHGLPSGDLPELTIKVRKSYLKTFEDRIRQELGVDQNARIELAGFVLTFKLVSKPFDENGQALPTRMRAFNGIYAGHDGGSDRGSNDALTCNIFIKQSTPATEKA